MANWYVWSGATGGGTGADWANAYVTLLAAATAKPAGDTFFVAHDHAETSGATNAIPFAGTEASPNRVYCVNRAGSVPPVSADLRTTATITTTSSFGTTTSGSVAEIYGIIFNCGTGAVSANLSFGTVGARSVRLVNCSLRLLTTATASRIGFLSGGLTSLCVLENCTVQFTNVSQLMQTQGRTVWRNTPNAILGATVPTNLMATAAVSGTWFVEGVDLSAVGAGKTLVGGITTTGNNIFIFKDCKLGAGATIALTPTLAFGAQEITLIRCDSGDVNYRTEKYTFTGTLTTETAIVRTGGASDGGTPISWKIVTSANSEWEFPFECPPITVWNETVGSAITVTVQGIWGGGATPLNDEIWIDVFHLGTSGFPLGSRATSTKADGLATGSSLAAGTGTWGGSTTAFSCAVTITPQEKGPITVYVRAATPSATFYVDPKPVLS